tara:strand:+ start:627 stop:791 length:165 start_codon:yes stop_codon:yes gene_type:complete
MSNFTFRFRRSNSFSNNGFNDSREERLFFLIFLDLNWFRLRESDSGLKLVGVAE